MTPSTGRKVLLLTGAAGRLGSEIIRIAASELDIIALTHRAAVSAATTTTSVFYTDDGVLEKSNVRTVHCDLSCEASLRTTIRTVTSLTERIDYVVNSAADVRFLGPLTDLGFFATEARRQMEINVLAPLSICSMVFHEHWKHIAVARQDAAILNVSSLSGCEAYPGFGQGIYAASKAALNMVTQHMAAEFGQYGVRANAICPGRFVDQDETHAVARAALALLQSQDTGKVMSMPVAPRADQSRS